MSAVNWWPANRPGTTLLNGPWLCTVETGTTKKVEILDREDGEWFRGDDHLTERERVTHVAYVPQPAV